MHQNKENQTHSVCRVPRKALEPPAPFILKLLWAYFEICFFRGVSMGTLKTFLWGMGGSGGSRSIKKNKPNRTDSYNTAHFWEVLHMLSFIFPESGIFNFLICPCLDCWTVSLRRKSIRPGNVLHSMPLLTNAHYVRHVWFFRLRFVAERRQALLTNTDVSLLERKADRVTVKRGSLNFTPHTQMRAHSPSFACVGNDCPYCRLLWSFPTRLCYASDSALQRLEYMRIHDPHVKVKNEAGPWKSFDAFVLPAGPPRHCASGQRTQRGDNATCGGFPCQAEGQITLPCALTT